MLDIRQEEEICCSCHYTESSLKSISEFMQEKSVYLELAYVFSGGWG